MGDDITAPRQCPDCGGSWDPKVDPLECPHCQLSVEDLEAAEEFLLDRIEERREDIE